MKKTIAIVGAGRVGRALGRRLGDLGWRIGVVVTRSRKTARAAVRAIGGGRPPTGRWAELFAADVILIALPDRTIEGVADRLAAEAAGLSRQHGRGNGGVKPPLRNIVVLHTSGSLSHAVLEPLRAAGAAIGAMHPMQTFSNRGIPRLQGVIFGLDGDARALRVARRIAQSLGGVPVRIDARSKAAYHTAGSFAAQHVLAITEAGIRILMRIGFTRRQATRALLSLARQTLDNIEREGARAAWTGPVPRGDYDTVAKHVAVLRAFPREFRAANVALGRLAAATLAPGDRAMRRQLERIFRKI